MPELIAPTEPTDNGEPDGMLAYALAIQNPSRDDPNWPLPSFDARDWAEHFVKLVREKPEIATDEGCMLGWFANALMRGFDEHAMRAAEGRTQSG